MQHKFHLVTVFLLIGLVVLPVQAATDRAALQQALAAGNYPAALSAVEAQLDAKPTDPELLFVKALTLTLLNRLEDASEIFVSLTRQYPQLPEPANNLAVIQARQGNYGAAQRTLQDLLKRHPDYAAAHENLGDVLTAQAESEYRRALDLGTNDATLRGKLDILQSLNKLPDRRSDSDYVEPQTRTPRPAATRPVTATVPPVIETAASTPEAQAVRAALENWRAHWAAGNVEGYLASYSADFVPPRGLDRVEWEAQRRSRVRPDRKMELGVSQLSLAFRNDSLATATFQQDYQSAVYSDSVTKKIQFRREGDSWKILREFVPQ